MTVVMLSPTLRRLLVELQTWCTPDCCKGKAFRVTIEAIGRWLERERLDPTAALRNEIANIESSLSGVDGQIRLDSRDLESDWRSDEFRAFWRSFSASFAIAASARSQVDADGQGVVWAV